MQNIIYFCYYFFHYQCLRLELADVMNKGQPKLLYSFMQFLKSEAAINVLQFCLQCGKYQVYWFIDKLDIFPLMCAAD